MTSVTRDVGDQAVPHSLLGLWRWMEPSSPLVIMRAAQRMAEGKRKKESNISASEAGSGGCFASFNSLSLASVSVFAGECFPS